MFKNLCRRPAKKLKNEAVVDALSDLETELIALEDAVDILTIMALEHAPPVYLCRCVEAHVKNLRGLFNAAWKSAF